MHPVCNLGQLAIEVPGRRKRPVSMAPLGAGVEQAIVAAHPWSFPYTVCVHDQIRSRLHTVCVFDQRDWRI
jgi:hypothetical protein